MTTTEHQGFIERCDHELTGLVDESLVLERSVAASTPDDQVDFAGTMAEVARLRAAAEAAHARLVHADDDNDLAAAEAATALRSFASALTLASLEVQSETDDDGHGLPPAATPLLDIWRRRLEELSLQAHLGGMDARDEVRELHGRLATLEARARRDLANPEVTRSDAKAALRSGIRELSRAFSAFAERITQDPAGGHR